MAKGKPIEDEDELYQAREEEVDDSGSFDAAETSETDEVNELFRKEVFLSIFNLWLINKEMTASVKELKGMMQKLLEHLQERPPQTASSQAAAPKPAARPVAATQHAMSRDSGDGKKGGIPLWAFISGGALLMVIVVIALAVILRPAGS